MNIKSMLEYAAMIVGACAVWSFFIAMSWAFRWAGYSIIQNWRHS